VSHANELDHPDCYMCKRGRLQRWVEELAFSEATDRGDKLFPSVVGVEATVGA
jgi:hypothetical protein